MYPSRWRGHLDRFARVKLARARSVSFHVGGVAMTKTIAVLFATLVVTALMPSKMALAQFSTAYVASNGTDTVGCGFRTSPCATFGKAISISFPGGTVRCV